MTPSFIGRMAMMLAGVRPSISFASLPTASTRPVLWLTAMIDGSHSTMPLPLAYTSVVAVPRSMARSFENRLSTDLGLQAIVAPTCASSSSGGSIVGRSVADGPPETRLDVDLSDRRLVHRADLD